MAPSSSQSYRSTPEIRKDLPAERDGTSRVEATTMRTVTLRILPIILALYVVAYMDRVSLSYAQLRMGTELGIDPSLFGLAASVFFVGYLLCEIPSNSILYRVGSRVWFARIGITWGLITVATGFVQNDTQLLIARFFLGAAEAGLVPGALFYLTSFFPTVYRARVVGIFFVAAPLSGVVAGPIAGLVLDNANWAGLSSWRWVYILFGIPAVFVGVLAAVLIRDRVEDAKWLSGEQRDWLTGKLRGEQEAISAAKAKEAGGRAHKPLWDVIRNKRTQILFFFQFGVNCGTFGLVFFIPQIVEGMMASGTSASYIGLLSALPFLVGVVSMVTVAFSSDRRGERVLHQAAPAAVGALGLAILPFGANAPVLGMIALCIAAAGAFGQAGPSYSLAQSQFVGKEAAIGLAAVAMGTAFAGMTAPYLFGFLTTATGTTTVGLYVLSGAMVLAGLSVLLSRRMWVTADIAQSAGGAA